MCCNHYMWQCQMHRSGRVWHLNSGITGTSQTPSDLLMANMSRSVLHSTKTRSTGTTRAFFSIVLMVVADARYGITLMDVGESGANSDGAIFGRSVIGQTLEEDRLSIPKAKKIPGVLTASVQVEEERPTLLLVIVGDEAFPLKPYLMRVFPSSKLNRERRIFNYRLCRA